MAGEKAKENKTLTARCEGCGTNMSTELLSGIVVGNRPNQRIVPVCRACVERGWNPKDAAVAEASKA